MGTADAVPDGIWHNTVIELFFALITSISTLLVRRGSPGFTRYCAVEVHVVLLALIKVVADTPDDCKFSPPCLLASPAWHEPH